MEEPDFLSVYERYARDVHRFALYLSANATLAQDITAETFARAWAVRDHIRVGTVKGYLLMIARNLYRDARRAPAAMPLSEAVDVSDRGSGPEASTGARHELKVVMHALQAIPEVDRAALLMATMEGLSHEAIGVALGLSTAAVKVRVHRARVKLNAARGIGGRPS